MKEKIIEIVTKTHRTDDTWLFIGDATAQILTLLKEEIEKVRKNNPYIREGWTIEVCSEDCVTDREAFDKGCQAILEILK